MNEYKLKWRNQYRYDKKWHDATIEAHTLEDAATILAEEISDWLADEELLDPDGADNSEYEFDRHSIFEDTEVMFENKIVEF